MAYSYKEYTAASSADGGRTYTFTFDAVAKNTTNIKVTIGGKHLYDGVTEYNTSTRIPGSGSTPSAEYTVSSGAITILSSVSFTIGTSTVSSGVPTLSGTIPLRIKRETNRTTAEVSFSSGSVLSDSDLNKANNQARFLGLEAVDRAEESIAIDSEDTTQYDAQVGGVDKRIYGVENPDNPNEAASKAYVDGVAMGSGANIATLTGTQVLTNKTLTSPVLNGSITGAPTDITFTSSTDLKPIFTLKNTNSGVTGPTFKFVNDKGAAGAANDICGIISFYGDDAAQTNIEFAKIEGIVAVHTDGQEGGQIKLTVASHDGELQPGLIITDGSAEDEVDVTIGNGLESLTTVAGDMTVTGDLTVSGDTTTVDTANLLVEDPLIVLQKSVTGTPANDCGLIIERGSSNNVAIIWDESADEFAFLSNTTEVGSTSGNINMGAYGPIHTTDITADGDITMATNKAIKQKGAFMQSSTHQALFLGA